MAFFEDNSLHVMIQKQGNQRSGKVRVFCSSRRQAKQCLEKNKQEFMGRQMNIYFNQEQN